MTKNKKKKAVLIIFLISWVFFLYSSSTLAAWYNWPFGSSSSTATTPASGSGSTAPGGLYKNIEKIPGLNNTPTEDFCKYMTQIINFGFATIGILAMFMLMIGAYQYLMAAGNLAKADSAKESISSALLGLALGLTAWLILNTINPALVKCDLKTGSTSTGIRGLSGGTTPGTSGLPNRTNTSNAPEEIKQKAKEYAEKYGVPESVAMGMLNSESGGRNGLTSSKGAQGLLQLMPGTGRQYGVTDPFNVDQNLDAGYHYVSDLSKQYNGDWGKALAAYNMGPNGFDKYMDGQRNLPKETNNYVNKIMGYCDFCPT